MTPRPPIAFKRIADTAVNHADAIVRRWLPDGRREGREWVSLNPTRPDRKRGSFKVNLVSGRWSDFATGDGGGDQTESSGGGVAARRDAGNRRP